MAEIEIGILDRQCLDRRLPNRALLAADGAREALRGSRGIGHKLLHLFLNRNDCSGCERLVAQHRDQATIRFRPRQCDAKADHRTAIFERHTRGTMREFEHMCDRPLACEARRYRSLPLITNVEPHTSQRSKP